MWREKSEPIAKRRLCFSGSPSPAAGTRYIQCLMWNGCGQKTPWTACCQGQCWGNLKRSEEGWMWSSGVRNGVEAQRQILARKWAIDKAVQEKKKSHWAKLFLDSLNFSKTLPFCCYHSLLLMETSSNKRWQELGPRTSFQSSLPDTWELIPRLLCPRRGTSKKNATTGPS